MPSIIMWCKHVNVFQMPSTILHLPNASQPSTSSNLLLPSHTLRRSSSHTWSMPSKDWFKKQRAFDSLLHDSDHLVLSAHLWTAPVELFFLLSPHQPVAPTSHLSFYRRDLKHVQYDDQARDLLLHSEAPLMAMAKMTSTSAKADP